MQITHVAIQYDGVTYSLPAPNRHHDVIRMITSQNGVGINGPDTQGFLTETGEFLGRKDAYTLAVRSGQLIRTTGQGLYNGSNLYSEDLW